MAYAPKPITITAVDEADYVAPQTPQPYLLVGDIPLPQAVLDALDDLEARVAALEALNP